MKWWMEIDDSAPAPKRGDLMHTNIGDKRERTWIILRAVRMKQSKTRRYMTWRGRWWELEPEMRVRLYRSAQRNGGQQVWHCFPQKKKHKKSLLW